MVPQETGKIELTVPVVEETAAIEKRKRVTGTVRLRTDVHEHEVVVDEQLLVEEVAVERVPVDRWVDGPVPVRQEGDTTIVPVLEEVVVVEKRLKLIEEVRLTKRHSTRHTPQRLTVRRQEAVINRLAPPPEDEATPAVTALGPGTQD
jgi:uncharacterized protein (TIGR02271 family)